MKVRKLLLVSAYDATSHRGWAEQIIRGCPEYAWTPIYGAARNFAWALRGRPLQWFLDPKLAPVLEQEFSGVVVTSTVDLAAMKALFPALRSRPTLLYMHENQFAYPSNPAEDPKRASRQQAHRIDACMVQLYALLAADLVVFNSEYNRASMREGITKLMAKMPVALDLSRIDRCLDRARIVAVPLEDGHNKLPRSGRGEAGAPVIVWNHRWEFDKAPERFLAALDRLSEEGVDFSLMLLGPNADQSHPVLREILQRHAARVWIHQNIENREAYFRALASADIAVSTALHDFQGVSMMEASRCGVYPVVPDRLAYREFYPPRFRYPSFPADPERECEALVRAIKSAIEDRQAGLALPRQMQRYNWSALATQYRGLWASLLGVQAPARL